MSTSTWISAARLRTLPAALAPVLIGTALAVADGGFHAPAALAALLGALLIQIGTNYANDYFDFVNGADTDARVGPSRATQAGLVAPSAMKMAFILTFALMIPVVAYLTWRAGWPVVAIGVSSVISGILYTGGPRPLGYMGLGDLFVLVFFGPVAVGGTYFVQTLAISPEILVAGLAPGLLSCAILVVNNLRDIESDATVGKNTLAVRFGPGFARGEYLLTLIGGALTPLVLLVMTGEHAAALLACAVLLPGIPVMRSMMTQSGAALDPNLGRTGKLLVLYSVLFSVGWVL
jgi:1,4-dihydroxy-2-naphthoate octaprenyltransferase